MKAWVEAVRALTPDVPHLSPEGARLALDASLDLLELEGLLQQPAPEHTWFVAARTVFTAPLEWIAVLTGRGGRVTLKSPQALRPWFEQLASVTPSLTVHDDRRRVSADLTIVMGSDSTVDALRNGRYAGFGHRTSACWWTDPTRVQDVVRDLVIHDGRGCMSPAAIFSPLPDAAALLHQALQACEVPRGALGAIEAARIRERSALARVVGTVHEGSDHTVVALPLAHLNLQSLPRLAQVHRCPTAETMLAALHGAPISVLGSDTALSTQHRTSPLGRMQEPPLRRLHDGVDWLALCQR